MKAQTELITKNDLTEKLQIATILETSAKRLDDKTSANTSRTANSDFYIVLFNC
jgi:hypothetical protein